ncbi:hypothetical protein AB4Y85_18975 [Microvirga sp. 2YAF29]|uniref:hypothetical protein n=1 Tax=Microvirga sp. 2YAF29 TaxID=3233031 RepID=UPI003F96D004
MIAMTEESSIFENEEWLVSEDGLEHKKTGYFIDRESLGQRREDGLWTWPLHMAEKSWCAMMPFAEAFSCAASVYDIETGADLARTFKVARCEVSAWPYVKNSQQNRTSIPAPLMDDPLRNKAQEPIYVWSGYSENSLNDEDFLAFDDPWRIRSHKGARPFLMTTRFRSARLVKGAVPVWQTSRRIRKTGTKLVRFLQAAWNIR